MSEVIRVRGEYYILATSPLADTQTRVLKQGETFAIFDIYGDVRSLGRGEQGMYHKGTRHLSRSELRLGDERPLLLGSSVTEDNVVLAVDLTNPDMTVGGNVVPRGMLHIFRSIFLWNGSCYQRLRLFNYADDEFEIDLALAVDADFADIFEVRGFKREKRGRRHKAIVEDGALVMGYLGLDGEERRTRVVATEGTVVGQEIRLPVVLQPQTPHEIFLTVVAEGGPDRRTTENFPSAIVHQREGQKRLAGGQSGVRTTNELFNTWLDRSLADLRMMITDTDRGPFPYAGVPWFASPFGRDAIITAYELLWIDQSLARGVLAYLAATQATEVDPVRESEPGKILHEQRTGELAALGEVPFGRYYGSVDSTPLFVALAGEYLTFTGDVTFIESIWSNLEAALEWIDVYGDADGDGFVEYRGSEKGGLVQQGWKDSHDSVFHSDGSVARPPIALCEVQGYVFWAKRAAANMARVLGRDEMAERLDKQATALQEAFEAAFWVPDIGTYALALDGDKRRCEVRASNAGHCLTSGIASPEHAQLVATSLLSDAFYSGWGVRTLASSEVRYGPITYHNGSVWPHDNALIGMGLAKYGFGEGVHRILGSLLDAAGSLEFHRLPELYCGFPRRPGQGPIEYPLACAPQAWAAGSVFLLLRATMGLQIDAFSNRIVLNRPTLPPFLREVHLRGIHVGDAFVDLALHDHHEDLGVNVTGRSGDVEVVVVK